MKAAIVQKVEADPVYGEFEEPVANAGEELVTVSASAMSQLTRGRASGTHYSSSGKLPFVAGVDGAGRLENGKRVYFVLPRTPFGGMAERSVVAVRNCIPIPGDLDDVTAAAIPNPGMSSWAALVERAKLNPGETVLVNGATGSAGRLAVQIAKHLGAGRVIATGRNAAALAELAGLGADAAVQLNDDPKVNEAAFKEHFAERVDIVLDYLWGPSAERLLMAAAKTGKDGVPIRFVHIGGMSAPEITLPGAVLRSSALELMGSGIGSVPFDRLLKTVADLLAVTRQAGFKINTRAVPLSAVESTWTAPASGPRVVFTV